MKQTSFWQSPKKSHGGSDTKGRRKAARPIVTKSPMHFTFKSTRARGPWSFHRFDKAIAVKVKEIAKTYRVKVRRFQSVGNHLHIVAQAATRREMQNFLRVLPQAIAFLVTGTRRGNAIGRFWDGLVHSRIVHWGKDWRHMQDYIEKNRLEAAGFPRQRADELYKEKREAWKGG